MKAFRDQTEVKSRALAHFSHYNSANGLCRGASVETVKPRIKLDFAHALGTEPKVWQANSTEKDVYGQMEAKWHFPRAFSMMLNQVWHNLASFNMSISFAFYLLRNLPAGMDMNRLTAQWMMRMLTNEEHGIAQYLSPRDAAHVEIASTALSMMGNGVQLTAEQRRDFVHEFTGSSARAHGPLGKVALQACAHAFSDLSDQITLNHPHLFICKVVDVMAMAKTPTKNWQYTRATLASPSLVYEQWRIVKDQLWESMEYLQQQRELPMAADAEI